MRRLITLGALAALLAGPAAGQGGKTDVPAAVPPPAASARPGGVVPVLSRLPDLAGFARQSAVTDFESRPGGAGLGAAVDYRAPGGPVITVYLYDRNRRDLRSVAPGPVVEAELVTAAQEIEAAAGPRRYRIAARDRAPDEPGPDGGPGMRCDRYLLAFEEGGELASFACAAVVRGHVLKLRVSHPRRAAASQGDVMPPGFAAAVIRALGGG